MLGKPELTTQWNANGWHSVDQSKVYFLEERKKSQIYGRIRFELTVAGELKIMMNDLVLSPKAIDEFNRQASAFCSEKDSKDSIDYCQLRMNGIKDKDYSILFYYTLIVKVESKGVNSLLLNYLEFIKTNLKIHPDVIKKLAIELNLKLYQPKSLLFHSFKQVKNKLQNYDSSQIPTDLDEKLVAFQL